MLCKICVKRAISGCLPGTPSFFCDQKKEAKKSPAVADAVRGCARGATVERSETGERTMIAPAGQSTARACLRSKLAALVVRRQAPPNPRRGEVEAPLSKGAGRVSGLGDSDGLCVAAHSRATSAREKGPGCRPPSPLSPATHSRHPVGAGHTRPATLPLPPCILCIVGRQATGPLLNRPAPSNTKTTCPRPLAGRLFF